MNKLILPELGEGITKAMIAGWHKNPGEAVKRDEDMVEVATDKAIFNIASPCDGVVNELRFKEGQEVQIGEVLAFIK